MCIYDEMICKKNECPLYKLFSQYKECGSFISQNGFSAQTCNEVLIVLADTIGYNLSQQATYRYIEHATFLIFHYNFMSIVGIIGHKHFFSLCLNSMGALVALGSTDTQRFNKIQTFFEIILNMKKKQIPNDEYETNEKKCTLLSFQMLQLKKDTKSYESVVSSFEKMRLSYGTSTEMMQRIQAQSTASQYLLGKKECISKHMINSRDSIYSVYNSIDPNKLSSLHYFVLAKIIEHHTETHLFSSVEEVIKELEGFIGMSLNDDVWSLEEAVNKVIFHRDVYRAFRMLGDERALEHLTIAEKTAKIYNLSDQLNKIRSIKNEWEHVELINDIEIKSKLNDTVTNVQKKHKCNTKEPFVFISYSHKDTELIKLDINRSLSNCNYWIDYENIDGGRCASEPDWTEKISPILSSEMCKGVIVYCSPVSILHSVGTLLEAEWLDKHRDREIYVFLCGFRRSFTPQTAAVFLENISTEDPAKSLRIKTAYKYILQATQSLEKYSYYFYSPNGEHLTSPDFVNWIDRLLNDPSNT